MTALLLSASLFATLSIANPYEATDSAQTLRLEAPDLVQAWRAADIAEIYIVRRDLRTFRSIGPDGVRHLGCRYLVRRGTQAWTRLEGALAEASVRIEPAAGRRDLRYGLVFGDRAGMVSEIYSADPRSAGPQVRGLSQRRQVTISPSFAATLQRFADDHRELAMVDRGRPELCEHEGQ